MGTRVVKPGWYDPRHGDPPVRIEALVLDAEPYEPRRTNYFGVYVLREGAGRLWADAALHEFRAPAAAFFVPYQRVRLEPDGDVRGDVIRFHANFLCVETFHAEVGCSGLLFNDPYGSPLVAFEGDGWRRAAGIVDEMHQEQSQQLLAHEEATLASLKLLLILASRLKSPDGQSCGPAADGRHPAIAELKELVERHYCAVHAPAEYAAMMHMTPKTLGRIVREQLGLTLTALVQQRVLTHAKWQLLHTLRPVKEIAREVGFKDELYFSRLFKKATGCSPTYFREFETEIRGGSNLSMTSGHASIQSS